MHGTDFSECTTATSKVIASRTSITSYINVQ
jgi:hypothetical protein